jgi:hypothetical protein
MRQGSTISSPTEHGLRGNLHGVRSGGSIARVPKLVRPYRSVRVTGTASVFICIAINLLFMCLVSVASADSNRVFILYQDSSILKSAVEIAAGISQNLEKLSPRRIDLYSEYLDAPRFPDEEHSLSTAQYIGSKYRKSEIDILVPIGPEALRFVLKHRSVFAPTAKVVFGDISVRTYAGSKLPEDFTGAITEYDIRKSADLAMGFKPKQPKSSFSAVLRNSTCTGKTTRRKHWEINTGICP